MCCKIGTKAALFEADAAAAASTSSSSEPKPGKSICKVVREISSSMFGVGSTVDGSVIGVVNRPLIRPYPCQILSSLGEKDWS